MRTQWFAIAVVLGLATGPSRSLEAQEHTIKGNQYFGCTHREDFNKILGYAVAGDNTAFKNGLAEAMVSGQCTLFNDGETVYRTDSAIFSGLIKIRRKEETAEYWTNIEAIAK